MTTSNNSQPPAAGEAAHPDSIPHGGRKINGIVHITINHEIDEGDLRDLQTIAAERGIPSVRELLKRHGNDVFNQVAQRRLSK